MPRTGVTETQFLAAVEALQARCEKITINTVRMELGGTGSSSTILAYLRKWKKSQLSAQQESLTALVPIPEEILALFAKAWSAAQTLAHAELDPQREALAMEAAGLKRVIEQAEDENEVEIRALDVQIDTLTTQLSEAHDKERVAQTQLVKLSEDLGYYRAKLEASELLMKERLAEMDAQLKLLADRVTTGANLRKEIGLPTP